MTRRTYLRLALAGMLFCLLVAGFSTPQTAVQAATYTVFSTADGGGSCPGATCTLRQAVLSAASGDTINFDPSLNGQTIALSSTQIDIGKNLTITSDNGSGGFYAVTVQQNASDMRIFNINSGTAVVTIAGLKLTGVHLVTVGSRGGAIFNGGTLTLDHVEVTGNTAEDSGGGIWNRRSNVYAGVLTLLHSTVDNNTYTYVGGANGAGIYNQGSTFGKPTCTAAAPCIASFTMVDSTISNNYGPTNQPGSGEGLWSNLTNVNIIASTIAFNRLGQAGDTNAGNVYWSLDPTFNSFTFRENIIADSNSSGGTSWDIATNASSVTSQGYNDIQNRNAVNITSGYQATDLPDGTDPKLNALAFNGGIVETESIPQNSPVIDTIPNGSCTGLSGPILVDERDSTRPSPVSGNCDMGAYEKANLTLTPTTLPIGVRNTSYTSTTLVGHGGKAPYGNFVVASGALPNGLTLNNSSGVISGTPTAIGSFTFGVNITDAYGAVSLSPQSYTIVVYAEASSTVTVNTTIDPGNVNCASTCSLRTALAYASAGDTISFSVIGTITISNANGTLNIQGNSPNPSPLNNLIIQGPGAASLAIDGNNNQRPFTLASGITATINDLTIKHGNAASGGGGAILTNGTLTVNNVVFSSNTISSGNGGAINNPANGPITVTNSTFTGNVVTGGFGGAIENFGSGLLTVSGSTFNNNTVTNGGGAIDTNGAAVISNSTFNNNIASIGGAINSVAAVTVSNSTISGNIAASHGGGIRNNGSTLSLLSDIIAKNASPSGPDVFNAAGTVTSFGHNLIGDGTSSGITTAAGDQIGTTATPIDPLLGPLASNGGSTQTMALPVNSPAWQGGDCGGAASTPPALVVTTDQRGQTRRLTCDSGAFEETFSFTPVAPLPNGTVGATYPMQTVTASGGTAPFTYALLTGTLPTGLSVNSSGNITGTPTIAGTFKFVISATDSAATPVVGSIAYTITVAPGGTSIDNNDAVVVFSASSQAVALTATVTNTSTPGIAVNEGTVTFLVFQDAARIHQIGASVTSGTVSSGAASAPFTLPGGTGIGRYYIEAVYNPGPNFSASSNTLHTLSIFAPTNSTISVTTLSDVAPNANCSNSVVTTCALRTAIEYGSAGDTISFSGNGTITLLNASGTLTIQTVAANPNPVGNTVATSLTINGSGASSLAIDGNNNQGVFTVNSGVTATINALTIQHGSTSGPGGGVSNSGTLTLSVVAITNNTSSSGDGGGVHNFNGTLAISNSTISGNSATFNGGGVDNNGGTLTIQNSTISGNTAAGGAGGGGLYNLNSGTATISNSTFSNNSIASNGRGGGVSNLSGAVLTIQNSTFSGNSAPSSFGGGGGVYNSAATMTISNSTFSGNTASSGRGGGLQISSGTLNLYSTIVAGSTVTGGGSNSDVSGTVNSLGHNLIGDGTGSSGLTNGVNNDQVGTSASPIDPLLGALASNGGPTQTMILPVNSPAYQAGACSGAVATPPAPPVTTDQRGQNRKATCDIGAFEETFTFTPNPLPNGVVGDPYSQNSVVTAGGTPSYAYVSSVTTLDGLTVTVSGTGVALSGSPTAPGTFNFTVTATDANGVVGQIYYTLTVSSPTATPTNTATATSTNTPTNTSTDTATNTATFTPTNTATNTATFTPSNTATNTATNTPTNTPSNTVTNTATFTPSNTATNTPTNTATYTPSNTATNTATFTPSNTATNTSTNTATFTPSNTATNTATSTASLTPSNTNTSTATNTPVPHIETIGLDRGGTFYLRLHNSTGSPDITVPFVAGAAIAGDWTNSGIDRIGAVNTSTGRFTICLAADNTTCNQVANQSAFIFGLSNDVPGSWRVGARVADGVSAYRPSTGIMYYRSSASTGFATDTMVFGMPGDAPVNGDWTGKGFDSPGMFRPSVAQFFLSNQVVVNGTIATSYTISFGKANGNYAPLAGSWLATLGHDGVGLFNNTTGTFYLKNDPTTSGIADNSFLFGLPGDQPVAGHWQSVYPPRPPAPVLIGKTAAPPSGGGIAPGDSQIGG